MSESLEKIIVKGVCCERDYYIDLSVPYMINNQCIKNVYYDMADKKMSEGELQSSEELDSYLKALGDVDITQEHVTFPMPPFSTQ